MPDVYEVKKYPNRRWYSVTDSCYVTVPTIAQAVKSGFKVKATEHKGGANITCSLLLEVLAHEQNERPTMSADLLHHLIRNESDLAATAITGATA